MCLKSFHVYCNGFITPTILMAILQVNLPLINNKKVKDAILSTGMQVSTHLPLLATEPTGRYTTEL